MSTSISYSQPPLKWLQFFPQLLEGDEGVQRLSLAGYGLWCKMLWIMHGNKPRGYLDLDRDFHKLLQSAKATPEELNKLIIEIEMAGVCSRIENTGVLVNRRMVRDEQIRQGKMARKEHIRQLHCERSRRYRERQKSKARDACVTPRVTHSVTLGVTHPNPQTEQDLSPSDAPSDGHIVRDKESIESIEREGRDASGITPHALAPPPGEGALRAFSEIAGFSAPVQLRRKIIATLTDSPDRPHLEECFTTWIGRGFKDRNLDWLFDWYLNGIRPSNLRSIESRRRPADVGAPTSVQELDDSMIGPSEIAAMHEALGALEKCGFQDHQAAIDIRLRLALLQPVHAA